MPIVKPNAANRTKAPVPCQDDRARIAKSSGSADGVCQAGRLCLVKIISDALSTDCSRKATLMFSREENELLTRVGPATPMGELMRRYWIPALLSEEISPPDCPPVRVRLLGEDLVAFRDTQGRV